MRRTNENRCIGDRPRFHQALPRRRRPLIRATRDQAGQTASPTRPGLRIRISGLRIRVAISKNRNTPPWTSAPFTKKQVHNSEQDGRIMEFKRSNRLTSGLGSLKINVMNTESGQNQGWAGERKTAFIQATLRKTAFIQATLALIGSPWLNISSSIPPSPFVNF